MQHMTEKNESKRKSNFNKNLNIFQTKKFSNLSCTNYILNIVRYKNYSLISFY